MSSPIVNSGESVLSDYYNQLPQEIPESAGRSFVYSFVATTLLTGGNAGIGLIVGSIATLASFIDSAIRPAISKLSLGSTAKFIANAVIVGAITSILAPSIGACFGLGVSVNVIHFVALSCICGLLFRNSGSSSTLSLPQKASTYLWLAV